MGSGIVLVTFDALYIGGMGGGLVVMEVTTAQPCGRCPACLARAAAAAKPANAEPIALPVGAGEPG